MMNKITAALLVMAVTVSSHAEEPMSFEEIHQQTAININNVSNTAKQRAKAWSVVDKYVMLGHRAGADMLTTCEESMLPVAAENAKVRANVVATKKNTDLQALDVWLSTTLLSYYTACLEVRGEL